MTAGPPGPSSEPVLPAAAFLRVCRPHAPCHCCAATPCDCAATALRLRCDCCDCCDPPGALPRAPCDCLGPPGTGSAAREPPHRKPRAGSASPRESDDGAMSHSTAKVPLALPKFPAPSESASTGQRPNFRGGSLRGCGWAPHQPLEGLQSPHQGLSPGGSAADDLHAVPRRLPAHVADVLEAVGTATAG